MSSRVAEPNPGSFLSQLIGKTVAEIFYVDYNGEKDVDFYLPWLFFITFQDFDKFLEIEGDFDGEHIKINLFDFSELAQKLEENDFPDEPDHWRVYEVGKTETLGKLLDQKILKCSYGVDKDEFWVNGIKSTGQKDVFKFLRLYFNDSFLTIFEWGGLKVTDDPKIEIPFSETFNSYETA